MQLRNYQQEAVTAILEDLKNPGASIVVAPTGSGKSFLIAESVKRINEPTLILQPSRELLAQNRAKLALLVGDKDIGTYSASFNSKEIKKFTFATIQSVYKKPELFKHIKLIFMDECALFPVRSMSSMYSQFFSDMGNPKIVGLTATPYRVEQGYERVDGELIQSTMIKLINRARNKNQKEMFWKRIIYHIPYKTLLAQGYLVPIEYINNPLVEYKEIPVNKSRSDYDLDGYSQMIVGKEALAVQTVLMAEQKHKSVLVFCATTDQAKRLSSVTLNSACVFGDTPNKQREQIIKDFKNGKIKTVYNYGVLTTGFDFPELECIVLVRPLRSPVLYNQICGRLTRTAVGKTKGILYDLTGSSKVLGPIEEFELYHNGRLWDIKSAKHPTWNNRVLYRMLIQEKKYV